MEGLIRGLADAVLNPNHGRDDDDDDSRDERSRSTWAEVVGGEQEEEDQTNRRPASHNAPRKEINEQREQRQSRRKETYEQNEWGSGGSRPAATTQEYGEKNDDGWETVGRKPPSKTNRKVPKNQWNNYKRPIDEQEYSGDVDYGTGIEPSEEELADIGKALNKLWDLDSNRLVPGKDYEIDCGEGKKVYQKEDMADASLFTWLSEDIFRRPTYSRFCALLDNYNPEQGCKEVVTSEEKQEQKAFIEEISRTAVIKYLHKYLSAKGVISENYEDFKRMLASFWFDLYGRGGTSGSSSAFEHVFVGEIKQRGEQEVSGFHNWIQFYLEEAKGRVNYQGYIFPRRRGNIPDSESHLLTIQFEWNGVLKSVSSTLVGVSPEFEFAIYTLCFYLGQEENHVELGPYPVNIKCYRLGNRIGSAFPVADS
ncbi:poly(U)-specific endoribonuclease-B-like isoform X2 [Salvia splendens]|uniref:poly(U)-specific endoribonuclease-B-like isoform X2 n=1 Tax=Salvia splendens TaxID=180675 RepID=UPI001C25D158|nr:poly(U)-specific endoribonuclease-B-like isoform X2 [Salvia splendens]